MIYTIPLKRVNNEILQILENQGKGANYTIETKYERDTIKIKIDDMLFVIGQYYPFRPPILIIQSQPYIRWASPPTERIHKLCRNYGINELSCYCCNSKLSIRGWYAGCKLVNVMAEVDKVRKMKRKVYYIRFLETLFKEKPQLNESIVQHTMDYIL